MFPDDDASFSCLIQGSSIPYWKLNGTDYDNLPSAVHDDMVVTKSGVNVHSTNITITARAEYNETIFQCVIENDGNSVVSDTATLYIQGKQLYMYVHNYE